LGARTHSDNVSADILYAPFVFFLLTKDSVERTNAVVPLALAAIVVQFLNIDYN